MIDPPEPDEGSDAQSHSASDLPLPFDFCILVIGGGAAGMMAAQRSVLNARRTIWLSGDLDTRRRSRAQWVSEVDNVPGLMGQRFPLSHHAVQLLDWMESHPELRGFLQHHKASAEQLEAIPGGFRVTWSVRRRKGPVGTFSATARAVVLATGVMDVQPHVGGEIAPIFPYANANQVLYCLISDGHRVIGHRTAVIGAGPRAVDTACLLQDRYAPPALFLLAHGQAVETAGRERLEQRGIPILGAPLVGFEGEARQEGLQAVLLEDDTRLPVSRLFVALGTRIHHALAAQLGARLDDEGYVLADGDGETSVPGLFVAGDLKAGALRQIISAWDGAMRAVEAIDRRLRSGGRG